MNSNNDIENPSPASLIDKASASNHRALLNEQNTSVDTKASKVNRFAPPSEIKDEDNGGIGHTLLSVDGTKDLSPKKEESPSDGDALELGTVSVLPQALDSSSKESRSSDDVFVDNLVDGAGANQPSFIYDLGASPPKEPAAPTQKNNLVARLIASRSNHDKKKKSTKGSSIKADRHFTRDAKIKENDTVINSVDKETFRDLEMKVDNQKMKIQELEKANEQNLREMKEELERTNEQRIRELKEVNERKIRELEENHTRKMQEIEASLDQFRPLLPAAPSTHSHEDQQQQQNRVSMRRSSQYSVLGNYQMVSSNNNDEEQRLENDTFSLMMISNVCSRSWALGLIAFLFQITLGNMIAFDQASLSTNSSLFDVPFRVTPVVRVGQFFSIILCLATQSDILTSVHSVVLLSRGSEWDVVIDEGENKTICLWIIRILLPNLFKFAQGLIVMYVSFVIIVQSDDIIVLLKDFTALMVLAETDNILFHLATYGYLGPGLEEQAAKVSNAKFPSRDPTAIDDNNASHASSITPSLISRRRQAASYFWRSFVLLFLFAPMLGGWIMIVRNQNNGKYFRERYPKCNFLNAFSLAKTHFGDGSCYGGPLNSLECEFEGGDCIDFNIAYPLCKGRDDLIDVQEKVGNGECDELFNIQECDFDGGDCCPPEVYLSPLFGDNQCHGGLFNTAGCHYDNGDCNLFNLAHPTCPLAELSGIEGAGDVFLGNGICESGVYSSEECGWEDGDCEIGQIGQKLECAIRRGSLDGRTLVTGPVCTMNPMSDPTIGPITVYHYNDSSKKWEPLGDAFTRDVNNTESFGRSISMNESGNRIAIGDPMYDSGSGQVRVYDYIASNDTWVQLGQTLHGELGSMFGSTMDMTANGSRLVTSASGNFSFWDISKIIIYELDTTGYYWHSLGNVIEGKASFEQIGFRYVRISSEDGNTIIFSTGGAGGVIAEDASARIYRYDKDILDWIQLGNDIPNPYSALDAASISSDGKRIAIASNAFNIDAPGQVQVFHYEENSESWVQLCKTIFSADSDNGDGFGAFIAMSGDGTILSIFSANPLSIQTFILDPLDNALQFYVIRAGPRSSQNSNMIVKSENDGPKTNFPAFSFPSNLLSGDGSTLFVSGDDNGPTFGRVYDLYQLFYIRCYSSPFDHSNGFCTDAYPYNTEQCGFDRGDCPIFPVDGYPGCFVTNPAEIGNGECHPNREMYNTPECGYDGGDCPPPQAVEGYPNCMTQYPDLIGNGECNPTHNTPECGYDGGDCIPKPVDGYLDCFVLRPDRIGDGRCDSSYNTIECGYDGGDCLQKAVDGYPGCFVVYPDCIGDGYCHSYHNTTECGYDGEDCLPNPEYPDCIVEHPRQIGNGNCDGSSYNTTECGYDGGDCFPKPVDGYPGCFVVFTKRIGDGYCHSSHNTTECGYDGGDCLPNPEYPDCIVDQPLHIGDGICDYSSYNTPECGYDGGDCIP